MVISSCTCLSRRRESSTTWNVSGASRVAAGIRREQWQLFEKRIVIELFARSPGMREAVSLAERLSSTDANVLITGESGVGKDLLASFIHSKSRRASQPFVKIDCATVPGELLEAELFGYERGAFSGAIEAKPGRLEAAHK